jgi:hypothetical protein
MPRGPFTYTIDWKSGEQLDVVAEVPIGAVPIHVRIFPAEPAIMLARHTTGDDHIIKIVYDVLDTALPRRPRRIFGVSHENAFGGEAVDLARCIGGFVHPGAPNRGGGVGWLLYELDMDRALPPS